MAHIEGVCGCQLAALAGRLLNIFTCGFRRNERTESRLRRGAAWPKGACGDGAEVGQLAGTFINFGRRVLNFTQSLNANGICILRKPFASRRFAGEFGETKPERNWPKCVKCKLDKKSCPGHKQQARYAMWLPRNETKKKKTKNGNWRTQSELLKDIRKDIALAHHMTGAPRPLSRCRSRRPRFVFISK